MQKGTYLSRRKYRSKMGSLNVACWGLLLVAFCLSRKNRCKHRVWLFAFFRCAGVRMSGSLLSVMCGNFGGVLGNSIRTYRCFRTPSLGQLYYRVIRTVSVSRTVSLTFAMITEQWRVNSITAVFGCTRVSTLEVHSRVS